MSGDTAQKIIQAAEDKIRTEGYQSFSFRTIATELGIKSASVHYHFATKGDLAEAVAARYVDRFFEALEDSIRGDDSPEQQLDRYVALFRNSLVVDRKLCLCGMLGAELASLPENVVPRVRSFFSRNIEWLTALQASAAPGGDAHARQVQATALLASLEGALVVARTLDDDSAFDDVVSLSVAQFRTALV